MQKDTKQPNNEHYNNQYTSIKCFFLHHLSSNFHLFPDIIKSLFKSSMNPDRHKNHQQTTKQTIDYKQVKSKKSQILNV